VALSKGDFEREMMVLDGEIKRLEAEYNMFFVGRLPRPPWETRKRVDSLVKKHDRAYIQNTADRFRFLTLQTRYAKLCELWERQLNAHEFGRPKRGSTFVEAPRKPAAGDPPPAEAPAVPERRDAPAVPERRDAPAVPERRDAPAVPERRDAPAERVVHVANFRDPGSEGERVKELYERLAEARKETGEAPLALDRVAALVKAQVQKYGADGSEVAFRVAMKDGKVLLTVKPVKDDE
jgi:hypothetical protein